MLAVDDQGEVVWDPGAFDHDECFYEFAPAGTIESESEISAPVDSAGRIFLEWNPGRHNGVSVVVVTPHGFDDLGTIPLPTYTDGRFYDAMLRDRGDGAYDIVLGTHPCYSFNCAGGPSWSTTFGWLDGDFRPIPETRPTPCGVSSVYDETPNQVADLRDITVLGTTCFEVMAWDLPYAPADESHIDTLGDVQAPQGGDGLVEAAGWSCHVTSDGGGDAQYRCDGHGSLTFTRTEL